MPEEDLVAILAHLSKSIDYLIQVAENLNERLYVLEKQLIPSPSRLLSAVKPEGVVQ